MSSVKRRINSTGRKRIKLESIDIRMLDTAPGTPPRVQASLALDPLEFPKSAAVAIEAYHRSSGMRFECGTVERLKVPSIFTLDDVDRGTTVLFRVKVIDTDENPGRLLGSAERIRARSEDDGEGRRSIFPLRECDLGAEIWKVEVSDDAPPVLLLNNTIPGFKFRILDNPFFQGLLLPAALRIVVQELADNSAVDEADEEDWKEEWLKYCRDQLGVTEDPSNMTDREERDSWVDDVVRRFCESMDFIESIKSEIEGTEKYDIPS